MKWWMVAALWAGMSVPLAARAEEPAAKGGSSKVGSEQLKVGSEQLADVVKLKNGGLVRGVIAELVPNDYVVIVLPSGEQRKFVWSEVEYAGPAKEVAAQGPPEDSQREDEEDDKEAEDDDDDDDDVVEEVPRKRVRPLITVNAEEANVSFESEEKNITFYLKTATARSRFGSASGYDRICTTPCNASLPAGTYEMALARPGEAPEDVDRPVTVSGWETLHATYDSHDTLKLAGGVILVVGLITGSVLFATSDPNDGFGAQRVIGLMTGGFSLAFGIGLAALPDDVGITVRR